MYLSFKNWQPMDPYSHHYSNIMTQFKIPSLKSYREMRDLLFAFKLINNRIDCQLLNDSFIQRNMPYNLRYFRTYDEETFRSNYIQNSTIPRLISAWHDLPTCTSDSLNLHEFKMLIKQKILEYS